MSVYRYILFFAILLAMQSCFTGIESTPRITATDVKRQHIVTTAEQGFLSDIANQPVAQWQRGKRFRVTDPKISLVLTSDDPIDMSSLVGHDIVFQGVSPLTTYMGEDMAVIDFLTDKGAHVVYKTQVPYDQIGEREFFEIPFAIDLDVVQQVAERIVGNSYFVTTPLWYDPTGEFAVQGLRHVEVQVDSVVAGNSVYPIRVNFHETENDRESSVFMTTGSRRTATRNFDTLFAFDNPRKKYPHISDDDWTLITHSRVRPGMNRDECRLALGAPTTQGQRPTTAGMVEYWSYADGTYLLFEDGFLSSFRR